MNAQYKGRVTAVLSRLAEERRAQGCPADTRLGYDMAPVQRAMQHVAQFDEVIFTPYKDEDRPERGHIQGRVRIFFDIAEPYQPGRRIARIDYDETLNVCWRRFIHTKELGQLLWADNPQMCISSPDALIAHAEYLTMELSAQKLIPPMWSEHAAVRAALDILVPMEERARLIPICQADPKMTLEVAKWYRVPEGYLKAILDLKFHDLVQRQWNAAP